MSMHVMGPEEASHLDKIHEANNLLAGVLLMIGGAALAIGEAVNVLSGNHSTLGNVALAGVGLAVEAVGIRTVRQSHPEE